MQTQSEPKSISLHFHHIPAFAAFLLSQKLDEFVDEQLKNAYTLNIPLMQAFTGMPAEEVKAITTTYAAEFLTYLSKNSA
ncbi:MAG TPA: hypothetical protein VEX63_13095, partial [Flavisolibacter sp.]|nr:hypothetical protein [Flavisolibacter sp.]